MGRRGWGALLIAMSVALAVAVPAVLGRRVSGQAVREPLPLPPAVGDCLLSDVNIDGSALKYVFMAVGTARTGPCSLDAAASGSGSFGEIVSITLDNQNFPVSFPNQVPTPEPRTCQSAAESYVGWSPGRWVPAITGSVILLGPDISQYLSGQKWIACVIRPVTNGYTGSIRGHHVGSAVDAFGRCALAEGTQRQPLPCSQPHNVEIFGSAAVPTTDSSELVAACHELLTAVTGMTDPAAGGAVLVSIDQGRGDSDTRTANATVPATCAIKVTGNRLLASSLIGLGARPLPWS